MNISIRRIRVLSVALAMACAGCASDYEEAARQSAERSARQEETSPEQADADHDATVASGEARAADDAVSLIAGIQPVGDKPSIRSEISEASKPSRLTASTVSSTPTEATEPERRTGPSIRLSAGVALAQTLPTGTAMGISVDYSFTVGDPLPSTSYVWVVESAKAETIRQPVPLNRAGTLQAFFTQLRPQHGPFNTHIEDSSGTRLSASISLR